MFFKVAAGAFTFIAVALVQLADGDVYGQLLGAGNATFAVLYTIEAIKRT